MNPAPDKQLKNEEWLKDLFDHAHDLIQIVHPEGTILYVNHAWSVLLQYPPEEIQGHLLYDFIDPSDRELYILRRNALLQSNKSNEEEITFNLLSKSGKKITVEGSLSVKKDAAGKPLYTRGIFKDITARLENEAALKRYHAALEEREYNLQQLLVHAPDAVIVINKESLITFWNPKAEEVFGWTAAEVLHRPLADMIVPHQHRAAHAAGMKRYLSTGEAHVLNKTIEITALNKSGNEFYVSLTISKTTQNKATAFVAFLSDITEQKNNQFDLERKTRELERSNANLEEFAHAASHDLKEPIRKVQTFASRLKITLADKMTADEMNYFNRLETAARRMGLLVDDLLEYSHVSQGGDAVETIDLNEVLHIVQEDLEVLIEEKKAHFHVDQLPTIVGHRRQIQQLFQNLLANALKYTKPGTNAAIKINFSQVSGRDIALNLPAEEAHKQFYVISIQDNGIGFEQKDADRIFKMFQRLHGSAEYKGTGVGLSIVRKVVENHKGYIMAEGKPNEGATFNVFLPVVEN